MNDKQVDQGGVTVDRAVEAEGPLLPAGDGPGATQGVSAIEDTGEGGSTPQKRRLEEPMSDPKTPQARDDLILAIAHSTASERNLGPRPWECSQCERAERIADQLLAAGWRPPQSAPDGWYPAAMREHDRANAAEIDRSAAEQRAASWWEAAKTLNRWGTVHRELHRKALVEIDRLKTVCKIAVGQRDRILAERDEARAKLDQVRGWLDMEEASTREWDGKHNPECECEVAQTTYEIIANIHKILDEVQQ